MQVETCIKCRRMFQYIGGARICPACKEKDDELYHRVKDYVYDHKGCMLDDVVIAFEGEVSAAQIKEWVQDDRLSYVEGTPSDLNCESCGKPIYSGRYCPECQQKTFKSLENAFLAGKRTADAPKKDDRPKDERMRFLGRR